MMMVEVQVTGMGTNFDENGNATMMVMVDLKA